MTEGPASASEGIWEPGHAPWELNVTPVRAGELRDELAAQADMDDPLQAAAVEMIPSILTALEPTMPVGATVNGQAVVEDDPTSGYLTISVNTQIERLPEAAAGR